MQGHGWIPPDGLERARPREVTLTHGGHALLALSLALWVGALGAVAGLQQVSGRQAEEQRLFAARSVEGVAEVVRLWRERGGGEDRPSWVEYRVLANGLRYPGQARLRLRDWRPLQVGSRLPVRYQPADPGVSRLSLAERGPLPGFVAYLAGGTLALFAGLVLLPLRCQRRLLSEGRPARGRVTRHKKGQHGTTEFRFEFTTLSGRHVTGKGSPTSKPPAVGSEICVLYDPDHPKSNAMYPFSLVTPRDKRSLRVRGYSAATASSARSTSAGLT